MESLGIALKVRFRLSYIKVGRIMLFFACFDLLRFVRPMQWAYALVDHRPSLSALDVFMPM
jgi:hypothetical protein